MKKLNVFNTVLLVLGLSALLFAINAYRKTLLLFNPQAVIAAYFTFGLFIGHPKDFQSLNHFRFLHRLALSLSALFDRAAVQCFPPDLNQRYFHATFGIRADRNSVLRQIKLSAAKLICLNALLISIDYRIE